MTEPLPPQPEFLQRLSRAESVPTNARVQAYSELLSQTLDCSPPQNLSGNLIKFAESIFNDANGTLITRPILVNFVDEFRNIKDASVKIEVGRHVLELIQPRVVSFDDQDATVKLIMADAFEEQEEYIDCAKVLQSINPDSRQQPNEKARQLMRIVRCYLEEDQPENASSSLNRVKNVLPDVTDHEIKLQFLLSQARILDSQRSFLEASGKYYDMSTENVVEEGERLMALSRAIICAILAPAGPKRGQTLARLYKDDRAVQVEEHGILEKIFFNRILTPEEVRSFAEKLEPHQLAKTADGSTVLEKAVLEHNLLGVSRLYANLPTDRLGSLLGVDAERAEGYAAQMIEQGRLAGSIDQIERLVIFEGEGSGERKVGHLSVIGRESRKWDANVQSLAEEVERVTTMILAHKPEFSDTTMISA